MTAVHRPYAMDTSAPPSVTQILDVLAKDGLTWGAAKETAQFAVRHQTMWETMDPDDAVDVLRRHFRGVWDHRALLGTAIHRVNERWAQGATASLREIVLDMQARSRLWQDYHPDALVDELRPMLFALSDVWRAQKPETVLSEYIVRYEEPGLDYIGTADWLCYSHGKLVLVDLKTTAQQTKGYYFDSWRLQLAALKYGHQIVSYDGFEEVGRTENIFQPDETVILHIRSNGKWRWIPVEAGPATHEVFLAARRLYGWVNGPGKRAGI